MYLISSIGSALGSWAGDTKNTDSSSPFTENFVLTNKLLVVGSLTDGYIPRYVGSAL